MNEHQRSAVFPMWVLAVTGAIAVCGCTTARRSYFQTHPVDANKVVFVTSEPNGERPRELRMFSAHDGRPVSWDDVMNAVAWSDVVVVGEQHDDAIGHAFQRALVEDVAKRWPQSALTMEMLERDDQPLIDDYAEDIIDAEAFATLTHSKTWGGKKNSWAEWYQPIIDAALRKESRSGGMKVIGANAPRRYVRLARTERADRLSALPKHRRALFDLPVGDAPQLYWERFQKVMTETSGGGSDDAKAQPGHDGEMTMERLVKGFQSQRLWDATMGASVVRAKKSGAEKVIHLVGQFHSDFEGGTVHEVRTRLPAARIVTISMQAADASSLREEDRNRADIVVYTGAPPEPEESESGEDADAATQPEAADDVSESSSTQPALDGAIAPPSEAPPEA